MGNLPKIGAFVLETLTTGMYTNPLDSLREFVQNAADSIRNAENAGLIKKGEGRIEIKINPKTRTLVIRDNGMGIHQAKVTDYLMNIGMSDKKIEHDAGFRGIGRLAGIAYCDVLKFKTSASGETTVTTIEMDCNGLRESISPALRQVEELADIMSKNCRERQENIRGNDHFFEVVMEGIGEPANDFLSWVKLEEYLGQVAPVEYDAQRFIFATKISEWIRKHQLSLPTVTLVIKENNGTERQVFKPYKTNYSTTQLKTYYPVEIKDISFFPEEILPGTSFWLWYSKTDLLGMIDNERVAGLRVRKNNILLGGPENVAELFAKIAESNRRFNAYYIGEIHVVSPDAIPNARRDRFEDAGAWPKIKTVLSPFVKERCDEIRKVSEARNRPVAKIESSVYPLVTEAKSHLESGFASKKERDNLLAKVVKEETKATLALESQRNPEDLEKITAAVKEIKNVRTSLEQENEFAIKKVRSNLDRKQRKVLQETLEILYEIMSDDHCTKRSACYQRLKTAILAKFQIKEGESEQ